MKFRIIIIFAILIGMTSCRLEINLGSSIMGSGEYSTEYRGVGSFSQVQLNGIGDARIVKGYTDSVTVEADDNIQPYITAKVVNNTLVIDSINGYTLHPTRAIRYTITVRQLNSFTLNGKGDCEITGVNADHFTLALNGYGNITAEGSCGILTANLRGTGNLDAGDLLSGTAYADLEGFGNMTVWATDYLNAVISGYGNIYYYGDPYLDEEITGIGSVVWRGY